MITKTIKTRRWPLLRRMSQQSPMIDKRKGGRNKNRKEDQLLLVLQLMKQILDTTEEKIHQRCLFQELPERTLMHCVQQWWCGLTEFHFFALHAYDCRNGTPR
jgi:hypothetical protein